MYEVNKIGSCCFRYAASYLYTFTQLTEENSGIEENTGVNIIDS